MCGLWAAGLPAAEHPPWRAFAGELGLLFQIVDDILDGDGYVLEVGAERVAPPRRRGGRARPGAPRARSTPDTAVLGEIVAGLARAHSR